MATSTDAQTNSRYERCRREAQEISGYYGQASGGIVAGGIRGGLAGAAAGAATGWVAGTDSGKAAKRGAALGALIGGVKSAAASTQIERKRDVYDRALERCLYR
jgi:hypothetical protein